MTLRIRLAAAIAVVVVVALAVLVVVVERRIGDDLQATTVATLRTSVERRVQRSQADGPVDPLVRSTLHVTIAPNGRRGVVDPSGPADDPDPIPLIGDAEIQRLAAGEAVVLATVDGSVRYVAVGLRRDDGRLDIEAAPLAATTATVGTIRRQLIVGGAVTLVGALAAAVIVVVTGLRPLTTLAEAADRVAAGDRSVAVDPRRGPREIRRLAGALDRMLRRQSSAIQDAEHARDRLEEFVADASHELRTPVTSVIGWADLLSSGGLDAEQSATAIRRITAESRRLAGLVDDLATLAWLDGGPPVATTPVDLTQLVTEAVVDARVVDPMQRVEVAAVPGAVVSGREADLRRVVDNLIRNARVHTPAGSTIFLRVRRDGDEVVLEVADDGPGFPDGTTDRVFDRFWRADGSRARTSGGSGLGLAIVAAVVRSHGGSAVAGRAPEGGALVSIRLPAVG